MAVDLFSPLIVHSRVQLLTGRCNGSVFRFLDLLSDRAFWRSEREHLFAMLNGLLIIRPGGIGALGSCLSRRGRLIASVGASCVCLYGRRWGWIQSQVLSAAAIADMHLSSPLAALFPIGSQS